MLTTLRIKNLALVSDLALELQPGCNIITGETGAGKSIIIGALNLLLGERADRTLIRSGSDSCSVEAVFTTKNLRFPVERFLEENGLEPCEENQLVLKRTFTGAGANRQFINGSPTTLGILSALGEELVDMHGPHDHQSLLHPAKQLAILDAFGDLQKQSAEFAGILASQSTWERKKSALIVDEKSYARELDLLRFQVNEIDAAKLEPDEETEVQQNYERASNASKLVGFCQTALGILSENEESLVNNAGLLGRTLQELQRVDATAQTLLASQEQIVGGLRELQNELNHYADKLEVNPERLRELEERLDLIHSLKRKYGGTLAEVITFGEAAREKLRSLEQRDEELERINTSLKKLENELSNLGEELSRQRKKIIPKLSQAVKKQLQDLGFAQCHFEVALSTARKNSTGKFEPPVTSSGLDAVEFQFAPNVGEPPRPLRAIASSGEMARVMLALKTVLAEVDEIPVLVFDEVDANVGGETAGVVGAKMRQISRNRQVLCITHLAPVAAHGSAHYLVTKQIKEGRTISEITQLKPNERVAEIARMLGGQSDAALKHAEELLGKSNKIF